MIEFRAWNAGNNEWMGPRDIRIYPDGAVAVFDNVPLPMDDFLKYYPLITIERFTGLRDRNKKKIYEGDIVEASIYSDEEPSVLEVEWRWGGFFIDYKDSESDTVLIAAFVGTIEVISHIHNEHFKKSNQSQKGEIK